MAARERLTPNEQILAYVTGLGIALAITALLLTGLGTSSSNLTNSLLVAGLFFIVLGTGVWLGLVKPWTAFDDLQTPLYTGHHADHAPAAQAVTPPSTADDLTLIEGLGPKTAAAFAEAGITSFAQIADMTPDALIEAAKAHGARITKADTWPEQARIAAAGDLVALDAYKADIKGGVEYDELTKIEGIGPKSQQALYAGGIRTFKQVAQAAPDELRAILETAGLNIKLVVPDTWPQQADLIVRGDLSGLKALQDQLKGGRA